MNAVFQFFSQHPFIATGITTWIGNYGISAAINSLDVPDEKSSHFYRWFFKFGHYILSQNPSRAGIAQEPPKLNG